MTGPPPDRSLDDLPPWIDRARLARHQQLLTLWHGLSGEELCVDLVVLAQLAAFRQRRETLLAQARRDVVERGATHDCGEWWLQGVCEVCGARQPS